MLQNTTQDRKPTPDATSENQAHSDLSGTQHTNIQDLQPQVLYDLNQQALDESIDSQGPLIHDVASLTVLRTEYEANENAVFVQEIDWLIEHGFKDFRRVKGDGDCFYRSFGFSFFQQLLESNDPEMTVATCLSMLSSTRQLLKESSIEEFVYEDFYDQMVALTENVIKPDDSHSILTPDRLLALFRDPQGSNTIVMYLRLVTASQIQTHVDVYENFVFHPDTRELMPVSDFCNRVMALGKEADHVEIQALCDGFHQNIELAYLGGHSRDGINFVKIPDTPYPDSRPIVLLYRPGHYDILLK